MKAANEKKYNGYRLLAVLAHPDDESFGLGGTLAHYATQGVEVHLVCATRGEVGEVDEDFLQGYSSISELRQKELSCAANQLGISQVHLLNYRDSGMPGTPENQHPRALINAPMDKLADEISQYIQEIKPQVVITFDPLGGYRHPDHLAIHQATVLAVKNLLDSSADPTTKFIPDKVYFHLMPRGLLRLMVRVLPLLGKDPRRFGKNNDIDLQSIAEVDFPVHAIVDYLHVSDLRSKAAACHASQGGQQFDRGFLGLWRRYLSAKDTFMRFFPEPDEKKIENDLFEGLKP